MVPTRFILIVLLTLAGTAASHADVEATLEGMSIEQKIGQMHIMGIEGTTVSPEVRLLIEARSLGGVYIDPSANLRTREEVQHLIQELQELSLSTGRRIPLFVATNHEPGIYGTLLPAFGASTTMGNTALGAAGSEELTQSTYTALARDARQWGFNLLLGPVLSLATHPENVELAPRAFSSDPGLSARMAGAAIIGLRNGGILPCPTYFPGMADFPEDTAVRAPLERLDVDAIPEDFPQALAAMENAPILMTSHVYFNNIDHQAPFTLSRKNVTGILREKFQYAGVIVTDAIDKGGATYGFEEERAQDLALEAGCDVIWQLREDPEMIKRRIEIVLKGLRLQAIDEQQINDSVRRILSLKERQGLAALERPVAKAQPVQPEPGGREALGIVVLRDKLALLPISPAKRIAVIGPAARVRWAQRPVPPVIIGQSLGYHIGHFAENTVDVRLDTIPTEEEGIQAIKMAQDADIVIVGLLFAGGSPEQRAVVESIIAMNKPTVLVALGSPADLSNFPEAPVMVAANGADAISLETAASVLFGKQRPRGKLSVSVGDLYQAGHALEILP